MLTLYGAKEERLEFSSSPAVLNRHSTGTLPGLTFIGFRKLQLKPLALVLVALRLRRLQTPSRLK